MTLIEDRHFEGQVALITGGGTGLGRAMALKLAGLGAKLVIASRSPEHLDPTAKEIEALGAECMTHSIDIRDYEKTALECSADVA